MKKTLTIVLALVLALSMLASFAFVINPGTGGAIKPEKNPLAITGFFATDNIAIVGGARVYAPLADNTNSAYAKNEVIRFAITMDVLNPSVPANGVDVTQLGPNNTLTVTSSTVDFSVSNMAAQQALHVPLSQLVTAINSKVTNNDLGASTPAFGAYVDSKNVLTIKIETAQADPSTSAFGTTAPAGTPLVPDHITLNAPTDPTVAKASYAFIFTGITKGEITEQGLAKLVTATVPGTAFTNDEVISVVKNGRTYLVEKVAEAEVNHPSITTGIDNATHPYYDLFKVGYRVYLVTSETATDYTAIPVAQLDSESVVWAAGIPEIVGTEVEGLGYSLGLEKINLGSQTVAKATLLAPAVTSTPGSYQQARVFRTVLSDGTVRYILGDALHASDADKQVGATAFTAAELTNLNTMLADFGFSTADNYTYKLEDKYFTTANSDAAVLTATYNNGTVVPVEPEEEDDLDEPTPDEDLDDDIDEDIDDDLDEDDVIDDEDEVPAETGDFASDIALALTAAAIVAAAALAFVMKKARD